MECRPTAPKRADCVVSAEREPSAGLELAGD
jgi:hypothetical protein